MAKTLIPAAALSLVALASGCSGDSETTSTGTCGDLRYELTAETEKDLTDISFELRSSAPGETWQILIDRDGEPVLDTTATTDDESELDAETSVPASDDEMTFTVTATPESGEPCVASVDH